MCTDNSPPAPMPAVLHEAGPADPIGLAPVDAVEIVSVIDNVTDIFMPDQGPARRPGPLRQARPCTIMTDGQAPEALVAEHGFSMLITVRRGARSHRLLFDAGTSPDGVTENLRRLAIDPGSIEAIVCSHGHFDHTTGIDGLIRAVGRMNMPILIHPHFWRRRRMVLPGLDPVEIPSVSPRALTEAGFDILEGSQPSFLLDGSVLVTGEVPRVTGYEPGFPPQQAWLDSRWQPDPLVLDDQAIVISVRDKGLVVLTGCGHAGIVNICRYARWLTGGQPLYAVLGGFHLNGPLFEPLIPQVLADLHELGPQLLVPAHCTGWRAQHAMSGSFGEAFVPNTVGSRFLL